MCGAQKNAPCEGCVEVLSVVEGEVDTRALYDFASRFHAVGFIFFNIMRIEAHGEARARFSHGFLLGFVAQKFHGVSVRLEIVGRIEVDVNFPKDSVFRKLTEEAERFFADFFTKREQIGVCNPHRATATLGERENIVVHNGVRLA